MYGLNLLEPEKFIVTCSECGEYKVSNFCIIFNEDETAQCPNCLNVLKFVREYSGKPNTYCFNEED